jgi:hypothetical protein
VALAQLDQAVSSKPFNHNTDAEPQFMLIQNFAWMMYQMINQARALDYKHIMPKSYDYEIEEMIETGTFKKTCSKMTRTCFFD